MTLAITNINTQRGGVNEGMSAVHAAWKKSCSYFLMIYLVQVLIMPHMTTRDWRQLRFLTALATILGL